MIKFYSQMNDLVSSYPELSYLSDSIKGSVEIRKPRKGSPKYIHAFMHPDVHSYVYVITPSKDPTINLLSRTFTNFADFKLWVGVWKDTS